MDIAQLKQLATQLSHPHGESGSEVGQMMYESNIGMIKNAIDNMQLQPADVILEIGHGNGLHIPEMFNKAIGLTYYGLDVSALMHEEAKANNLQAVENAQAFFERYDGNEIPYKTGFFNKIFTVNTIYFWKTPDLFLQELYRVLEPEGVLIITFAQSEFMQQLPFTPYGFELYDTEKLSKLVATTEFTIIKTDDQKEEVYSKSGEKVVRWYTTAVLEK